MMADGRRCNACGKPMVEGFCIHDGEAYYCSDECLHTVYTQEEYMEMYEEDEAYWTEWEDEDEEEPETKMIRVGYKAPDGDFEVREIPHELSQLQALVGGYIEIGGSWNGTVQVLCNEEGRLMGLPYNYMGLVGSLVFVGVKGTNFRSLTDDEIKGLRALINA